MKLPPQWTKHPLRHVAHVQTRLSKSQNRSGPFLVRPYLRVANVQDGYLDLSDIREIEVPIAQVERFRVHAGDVLLTEGGDFDKLGRGSSTLRIPPRALQDEIALVLATSRRNIEITQQLLESLKTQKRGLMQKLLTGQWRLPLPSSMQEKVTA